MEVDYLELSRQYASFLAAVGGVSITVLTLVLTFDWNLKGKTQSGKKDNVGTFLVAALVVATSTCFIGAHMMADTAAFISNAREAESRERDNNTSPPDARPIPSKREASGERLFLLASTNIFIAIILVLFALMLLPMASGKVDPININLVCRCVFWLVGIGVIGWLIRAVLYRMPAPSWWSAAIPPVFGVGWGYFLNRKSTGDCLRVSFILIAALTVGSLLYAAWTFDNGGQVNNGDIFFFASAITFSYVYLAAAIEKIMSDLPLPRPEPTPTPTNTESTSTNTTDEPPVKELTSNKS